MTATPHVDARRSAAFALLVGAVHAVGIAAVVRRLDYPVGGLVQAPGGAAGAVVGLVALLGVPAYVAARYRVVSPLAVAGGTGGWAVYREFTTPAPEFSTLGGHTVVQGTRYVDAYVDGWYLWLFAALLVGAAEYVVRTDHVRLPDPSGERRLDRLLQPGLGSAVRAGLVAGAGHLLVLLGLAADWGYFAPGGFLPAPWYVGLGVLAWTVVGLAVVGAMPAYLLVRLRLVAPTAGLAWLVRHTGWTQQLPLPDDALPVYFLGWFFFAGLLLAAGGTEYAVRWSVQRIRRGR